MYPCRDIYFFWFLNAVAYSAFCSSVSALTAARACVNFACRANSSALNGFVLANLSRWWGNRRRPFLLFSSFGCLAGALLIFGAVYGDIRAPFLAVAGVILMAFAGNVSPIYVALVRETNEEHRFGTALSVGNCFAYGVTAVFGGVLGRLMDVYAPVVRDGVSIYGRNSYLLVFGVLLGLTVFSAFLSLFLRESYGRDISATVR